MKKLYKKLIDDGILKEHNLKAYMKVIKMFEKSNRVGIVHATGTGKSFIALQLMYDNSDKKIVYLVPRNVIGDQIEEHINGLSLDAREKYFKNVEIMSYQKLIRMSKDELKKLDIDYLITDEFHHIGAPVWTNAIDLLVETHPNLKIFGMTATPIRSRGTSKQEDISDTFFDGHIASTYTLPQAIADGVLMPPVYKGAVYKLEEKLNETEQKVRESNLSEVEKKEYLERIENAKKQVINADSFSKMIKTNIKPNGKYIVFCPRGKREEYQIESEKWFNGFIDEENITRYFVDSKYPKQSKINSEQFYNDHDTRKLRLMFAMDMYTEGVHVPDIDGIIMMRPTKSYIMFSQMIGRVLNKDKQNLILDFVNNYEYIMKLKDYTKKELELRKNVYLSDRKLKNIFEQFDIELENINILNMLEDIDRKVDLSFEQKIDEYIELLNSGYIPKTKDIETKFSNGELINYFWSNNKRIIIERLNNDVKYEFGYVLAHEIINNLSFDKISDYIELLNQGYIPKVGDYETKFSNGELINTFWNNNKETIIERLNNDSKYKDGYVLAHNIINNLSFDKISDFIELLNNGYIPMSRDKKTKFSNGDLINYFWSYNKETIIERLNTDFKYKEGYTLAHNIINNLSFDKVADYIELLNNGYIPMSRDKKTKFSNGEFINSFWMHNKDKIIERLNTDFKYKIGYEYARNIIKKISFDKIHDYIELLEQGYVPKSLDKETKFSNGELINTFWSDNKDKIIERLNTNIYKDYKKAKEIINNLSFDKISDYIELLNTGYIPRSKDIETRFSNGELINTFWCHKKEEIIKRLNTDIYKNYIKAHETIDCLLFDKIADYIELLNTGYIPRSKDIETKFSNGEPVNYFWSAYKNKDKVIERLNNDPKYEVGYDLAKRIVLVMTLPKEEQKVLLKELKEYISNMYQDNMSKNGGQKK